MGVKEGKKEYKSLLEGYIKLQIRKGFNKDEIKRNLIRHKWPEKIADDLIKKIVKKQKFFNYNLIVFLALIIIFFIYLVKINFRFLQGGFILLLLSVFLIVEAVITIRRFLIHRKSKYLYRPKIIKKSEEVKKEEKKQKQEKSYYAAGEYKTDLDKLYEIVQSKGKIKILEIMQIFNVTKVKAEEWALILAEHELIDIYYPTFGSPELRKIEKK